jgi:UDP-glucose:(heptosyl)LPS alpha-1,3-glucosyltransferase
LIRGQLGVHREILFLFVAHNFRLKGLYPVLDALRILVAAARPVHLAVVGGGPVKSFQQTAARLGVSERVTFCGVVDDTAPYYAAADAFVHPTFYDPCSLVTLEAWASGLPIITSRFNGAAELMTPGREGFVIDDPWDARQLANKIELLLDETLRAQMAEAGRRLALEHPSEKNFKAIEEIYHQCAERR